MSCSAYISYQIEGEEGSLSGVSIKSEEAPPVRRKPAAKHTSTSFVLVDPSNSSSKGGGKDARSSIRKHASKACAAQRLATIAEKKKSLNQLSKRERQRQQAAERLEAALLEHAKKFCPPKEEITDRQGLESGSTYAQDDLRGYGRRISDSSATLSDGTLASRHESARKKCSIPWLLSRSSEEPPDSPHDLLNHRRSSDAVVPWRPRPGTFEIPFNLKDRMRYADFHVTIDDRVQVVMDLMENYIFEFMSLRLPTKADKQVGKTNLWQTIMPTFVMTSEPLFWAMVLCAGTLESLRQAQDPATDSQNLKYRDLAIRSVNKRLQAPEDELVLDCGLVSAIASLGTWERQLGSREIWRTHRKGVDTLLQKLRALRSSNKDNMIAQIIASCHDNVCDFDADMRSSGFIRICKQIDLDPDLMSSLCACQRLEYVQPNERRFELLESTAAEILKHTTLGTMSKVIRFPNRINLEMHVLVQSAGVSMVNFLAGPNDLANVDPIDLPEMCQEAIELTRSVSSIRIYDELLLWAIFTIHSLNYNAEPEALQMIAQIARRLQISGWPSLQNLLRSFVYLETAKAAYQTCWTTALAQLGRKLSGGQEEQKQETFTTGCRYRDPEHG